jgi:2-polyprenyl-3-methyl-5-hydroxy-6-metoxy-1,4-benzoquinol methylase
LISSPTISEYQSPHGPPSGFPTINFHRVLDIGCGWGTLVAYAAKNFGCDVTGVTLAKEQAKFGTERIANNGVSLLYSSISQQIIID